MLSRVIKYDIYHVLTLHPREKKRRKGGGLGYGSGLQYGYFENM